MILNLSNHFKNYNPIFGTNSNRFCPNGLGDEWLFGYIQLFGPRKGPFNYDPNLCRKVIAISGPHRDKRNSVACNYRWKIVM